MAFGNTIKVVIGAVDKSGKAFKSVDGRMNRLKASSAALVKTMAPLMAVGAAAGIVAVGKSAIDSADKIQKLSLRMGVSTEALSQYEHVAKLSGTSFDTLTKSIAKMQKNMSDAEDGLSTAKLAFQNLGLSVEDLKGLKPEEQFELIGDKIAGIEDPARRTQVAMNIFGRAGSDLIPIFSQGAGAVAAMREEAHIAGLTLSQEMADGAAAAADAMTRLESASKGFWRTLTMNVAPGIASTLNVMNDYISANNRLKENVRYYKDNPILEGMFGDERSLRTVSGYSKEFVQRLDEYMIGIRGITASALEFQMVIRDSVFRGSMPWDIEEGAVADYNAKIQSMNDGMKDFSIAGTEAAWVIDDVQTTIAGFDSKSNSLAFLDSFSVDSESLKDLGVAGTEVEWALESVGDAAGTASTKIGDMSRTGTSSLNSVQTAAVGVGNSITSSVTAAVMDTKRKLIDLQSIGASIVGGLVRYGLGALAFRINPALGLAMGHLVKEKATGGPVSSGTPYVVGEEGPELFVPNASGTIIPNGGSAAGTASAAAVTNGAATQTVNNIVNIYSQGDIFSDPIAKRRVAAELREELAIVAKQTGPAA